MIVRRALCVVLLLVAALHTAVQAQDDLAKRIVVEKKPVIVERKSFDPKHPPADMPPLHPPEAAVTRYTFSCSSNVSYQVHTKADGEDAACHAIIETLTITLGLQVVIWLPDDAPPKLKAHEEGHRQIAEMFYDGAENAARDLAKPVVSRKFTARGPDCEGKIKSAMDQAINTVGEQWMAEIVHPAGRVEELFDEITDHGRKLKLTEKDAIRQAMQRYEKQKR